MKIIFSSLILLVLFLPAMPAVDAAVAVQDLSNGVPAKQGVALSDKSPWTLDELINEAVAHYPETLNKLAALETAKANEDSAFWQFFPSPYVDITHQNNQRINSFTAYDNERIGVYGIKQPIWSGGKLISALKAAKSGAKSAELSVEESQLSIAHRVVASYQSLLQYRLRIKAQMQGIELLMQYAAMIQRRIKSGVSADVDQILVLSRLSQARSDLTLMKAAEFTALTQLAQLAGKPLERTDIADNDWESMTAPLKPDNLIEQAYRLSPALRRLKEDIKTTEYQAEQVKAAPWPNLSVKAEYTNGLFWQGSTAENSSVYAVLEFSPGAGLSSIANTRAAVAKIGGLKQTYEAALRDLKVQIQSDYENCNSAFERLQLIKKSVQSSREVLESYTRLFVAGKRTWLDVLNSAQEHTNYMLATADICALYVASVYRLRLDAGDMPWLREKVKW